MTRTESSQEWFNYAKEDLNDAMTLLSQNPRSYRNICYLCEQAVEKALKGFLIVSGVDSVPRSHDLETLCLSCAEYNVEFDKYKETCFLLSHYGTQVRYPSDIEVEKVDATYALQVAEELLKFTDSVTVQKTEKKDQIAINLETSEAQEEMTQDKDVPLSM